MTQDEPRQRQQELLLRSTQLRLTLAQQTQVFRKPLAIADRGCELIQVLANKPFWPLGGALLLLALRPRRALAWGARLWWAYRSYRQARRWFIAQG
jgi:hypothetical protein